ncbi:MAG: P-II family nitrogen regulator [Nitrososphaeraceae archaeon]
MKKIEAVVPHARLDLALSALKQLNLGGLTYYESKGRGQLPRYRIQSSRGTSTYVPEFNVNSTIVIVTKDSELQNVVNAIVDSASTGLAGEGKIFVSDIEDVVDIGSKRRGEDQV